MQIKKVRITERICIMMSYNTPSIEQISEAMELSFFLLILIPELIPIIDAIMISIPELILIPEQIPNNAVV